MARRIRYALRLVFSHPAVLACVLVAAALATWPAMGPRPSSPDEELSVEEQLPYGMYRSFEETRDGLAGYVDLMREFAERDELALSQERLITTEEKRLEALDEALSADDVRGFVDAAARYAELQPSGMSESQALQFRALSKLDDPAFYTLPQTMPAAIYLTSRQFNLSPVVFAAGGLMGREGFLSVGYDGSLDFLVWAIPVVVAALVGAGLGRRESRLGGIGGLKRMGRSVMLGAVSGASAALIVTAPACLLACAHNGIGDLAYPVIVQAADATYGVTTAGVVLIERAALLCGMSLVAACLGAASCRVAGGLVPAACVCAAGLVLAAQPWYFSLFSPLRDVARLLPATYVDPERFTGSADAFGAAVRAPMPPGTGVASGILTFAAVAAGIIATTIAVRGLAEGVERWRLALCQGRSYRICLIAPTWSRLADLGAPPAAPMLPGDPLAHGPPAWLRTATSPIGFLNARWCELQARSCVVAHVSEATRLPSRLRILVSLNAIGIPPPGGSCRRDRWCCCDMLPDYGSRR